MNVLRIKSGPARRREPTDEELAMERKLIAAQLVALRIVNGLKAMDVAKRMGYLHYGYYPRLKRWGLRLTQWYWAPRKAQALEAELPEARLSTLQRYARAAGARVDATLVKPRPKQSLQARAAAIRRKRRLQGKKPSRRYMSY